MRRLLPDPAPTTVEEQVAGLDLVSMASAERPYVITNFALTLDGRAAIGGRSGPIGSRTDVAMLKRLRAQVDAVLVGAGTMRAERYGRLVPDAGLRAWRERIGLAHDPLAVIVTASMELPWEAGLFADGGGRVLLLTSSEADPPPTETPVRVARHPGRVDLAEALRALRTERGVRALLCEGGPRLHAGLLAAGLVDELFLTVAPKLAGGREPTIVAGDLGAVRGLELRWLLAEGAELFARYRVTG